jgi:hypothetical protein
MLLVTSDAPGLKYSYYEGAWAMLPSFASLTALKTGMVSNFDLSVANRAENYAILFTGYILIPASGQYTFWTMSDDGSKLYIDNQQVVNNDGGHAPQEAQGTVTLAAGLHAIQVSYFQSTGGAALSVYWAGPGFGRQQIPAGVFVSNGTAVGTMYNRFAAAPRAAQIRVLPGSRMIEVRAGDRRSSIIRISIPDGRFIKIFANAGSCEIPASLSAGGVYLIDVMSNGLISRQRVVVP